MKALILTASLLCIVIVCNLSCKKDAPNPLIGNWKMVGLRENNSYSETYTQLGQTIQTVYNVNANAKNLSGSITFTGTQVISHNISYEFDTVFNSESFINTKSTGITAASYMYAAQPLSSTNDYNMRTGDSVIINGGFLKSHPVISERQITASRMHFRFNKDTLLMESSGFRDSTFLSSGIMVYNHTTYNITAFLLKD